MANAHIVGSNPLPIFENIEARLLLDSQVGAVTMPYTGYLSAAVYDSSGVFIATLDDATGTPLRAVEKTAGSVAIWWDGKDEFGRTVMQDGTYTMKTLISQVDIVDQGGVGDSEFSPVLLWPSWKQMDSNDHVLSVAVDGNGALASEMGAGGTFARAQVDSYYGDTGITAQTFNAAFNASGTFDLFDTTAIRDPNNNWPGFNGSTGWSGEEGDSAFFIGHLVTGTKAFIGMMFEEGSENPMALVRVRAVVQSQDGLGREMSTDVMIPLNYSHSFSYTYNPNQGSYGTFTVTIDSTIVLSVPLTDGFRYSGYQFNAFGMGIAGNLNSENDATDTIKAFIDDVSYSGRAGIQTFSTTPSGWTGSNNTANGNNYGWGPFNAHKGHLYTASYAEEGAKVRATAPDGTPIWFASTATTGNNIGIATDGTYVYATRRMGDEDQVEKIRASDGAAVAFTQVANGLVVVNNDPYEARPLGQNDMTPEQRRLQYSTWGIAADGSKIFVSNYRKNLVHIYDSTTGQSLGSFSVTAPLGIAVDGSTIWVANGHRYVTQYSKTGVATGRQIDLGANADPSGVTIRPSNHRLFVSETGTGHRHIHEYDINGTGTPALAGLQTLGSEQGSGAIGDDTFHFETWAGIAVTQDGILNVVENQHRIQQFYIESNPALGITAGDLYDSIHGGPMAPSPIDTFGYGANGTHYLVNQGYVYEVDPEYAGGPREGWMGDGSWRLVERYNYDMSTAASWNRTLMDGQTQREFTYSVDGRNLYAWALEPNNTMRLSAIVGIAWTGVELLDIPDTSDQFNWTDTDGDGEIDWNGVGYGQAGEVTWFAQGNQVGTMMAPWVDDSGNVWARRGGDLIKVPLEGFDAQGNPIYNWSSQVTVIPYVDDELDFKPGLAMKLTPNGAILVDGQVNTGQGAAAYFDSNGNRMAVIPSAYDVIRAVAVDETDTTPDYIYTAHSDWYVYVYMWTTDGMMVGRATYGAAGGYTGGWVDHPYGIGAFTHPITGQTYIYAEEVEDGRSERYRVDNLSTVQRTESTFSWTASHPVKGQWTFDSTLNDSVGTNHGTFYGGTPSYVTGKVSNGINLDGVDDYISLPYANDAAAYTVMAWVKVDAGATTNRNIIVRTSLPGPGTANSFAQQLRINAAGKFEHFTMTEPGIGIAVAGTTTVQAGVWYHVAISASSGDKARLFVNGQEEGTAANMGATWTGGDRFHVGNSTYGGFSKFDGVIDDVRVYDEPLLASDITVVAGAVVYVNATDPTASEQGQSTGTFTIRRTTSTGALTVNYTMSGTAVSGSDYSSVGTSVVIPDGSYSAAVTITPVNDALVDPSETVILTLGSGSYLLGTPVSAYVVIADDEAIGDIGWTGSNNSVNGNSFNWSYNTSEAGGVAGEIGGMFSRYQQDAFYGDTNLTTSYSLANAFSASGKLDFNTITSGWAGNGESGIFLGHFSEIAEYKEFVGFMLEEPPSGNTQMRVRARVQDQAGTGSDSTVYTLNQNGNYTWSYSYDPTIGAYGTLTVNISTLSPMVIALTSRPALALDAFGLGYTSNLNSADSPTYTAKVYMDDLTYSGSQMTLPQVGVTATDASASETGLDTGTFTVTRSNSSGDLTVNYTVSGTATSGSDFSALSGSVVIANGSTSAIVTLTPIDDSLAEVSETVTLTISANAGVYTIGTPSATVNIADNEPSVSIVASDSSASETGPGTGTFVITRTTTSGSLTVNYSVGGTATSGSDFSALSGSVVISSGQSSAAVTLTPIDDVLAEITETVALTISSSANYSIGSPSMATAYIADNEPTVTVVATDPNAAEAGPNTGIFTVTRTNTSGNLTVYYNTTGSTATSGTDYSALTGSVVISSGQSSATVTVTPIDDGVSESSEAVALNISSNSGYTIGSPSSATVSIADNDQVTGDFSVNPNWTGSGNTTSGNNYGYSFSTSYAGGATGEIGGTFARNVNESYYADTNLTQSFTLSNTITGTGKFTIQNQNNTNGEWMIGHLSSNTSDKGMVGIEFLEQDSTHFRFRAKVSGNGGGDVSSTAYVVNNGDYNFEYTYDPSIGSYGQLSVRVYGGGYDQTATMALTSSVRTEGATLNGFGIGIAYGVAGDNQPTQTVQMYVDDVSYSGQAGQLPTITVNAIDASAAEQGADTGTFTVSRTSSTGALTVNYTVGGTATSGSDFSALAGSVVIADGQTSATVTVTPIDDAVVDPSETVILTITDNAAYNVGSPGNATVTITDNDTPTVTIAATDASAAEPSDTGTFTVTRTTTSGSLTVYYNVSGTATSATDYSALSGSVVISSGQSSAAITVTPVNDITIESSETVVVTLSTNANYTIGSPSNATVNIADDDTPSGSFGTDPNWTASGNATGGNNYGYSASTNYAGGGAGEIGGTFTRNVSESYYADTSLTGTFTLANTITATGKVDIFGQINTDGAWMIGHLSSNTGEKSIVGIEFLEQDNTSVRFRAKVGGPGGTDAVSGAYVLPNGDHNFEYAYDPAIGSYGQLTVRIYGGGYDQTATVALTSTVRNGGTAVNGFGMGIPAGVAGWDDATKTVKMYIDDVTYTGKQGVSVPTVTVSATDASAAEPSDTGTFTVTRSTSTGALTVYYTVGGTATSASDYSALTGSVVIANGSTSATVTLTPINDTDVESTETVILTLTTDSNYTVGSPSNATVNIADNDTTLPTVTINATDSSVAELGPDTGTFTITRTTTTGSLTVYYARTGTATSGSDFSALSGSVVISAGQTSATVTLTPIDDTINDAGETVALTISTNANYTVGAPSSASVTITDNDPVVTVSASDANAAEPSDTGTFTVSRNNTTNALTVYYTVSGTATSGSDFSVLSGSAVISSGQTSATVTVTPIDDALIESSESVILTLSTNANYTVGSPSSAVVNIADNDVAANPTGRWTFNSTLNDSVGTNHGTFNGGTVTYGTGKIANALNFDGSNDYVNIPYVTDSTAYTITAWVKPTTDITSVNVLARTDLGGATGNYSHQLKITSGSKFQHYTFDGAAKTITGTTTIVANTWYHVAIVASNSGMARLYVNGKEEGTAVSVGSLWTGGDRFWVGSNSGGGFGWFAGQMDDVRIYEQALTAAQVKAVYADVPPNGKWTFDDTLNDAIGTNHGTFSGGTPSYVTGRIGAKAIDLDGTDDYVQMMYSTDPTAYTISAWVKPTDITAVNIVARAGGGMSHQIRINASSKFEHYTWDGAAKTVTGTTTVEANTWYHVAIVATNSGQARLYVNGQEEGTAVSVGTLWTGGDRWQVGVNFSVQGFGFFDGLVDDVRVYEQALTAAEIVQIAGYAHDGFESGTTTGGSGWGGAWTFTGGSNASIVTTGTPKNGTRHLRLLSNNGVATRAVDLSGVTSAHLVFDWKANSFEAGETAVVEIYNGTSWQTVQTISDGQDDNAYHHSDIDLSPYTLTSGFQVRFRSLMGDTSDYFYIDNLLIVR